MDTQLGAACRYVDPVFQHGGRHDVGFVCDLVKAGSVGFVEDAVEHVVSFSLPRKLELRGSLLMRVQATDIFRDLNLARIAGSACQLPPHLRLPPSSSRLSLPAHTHHPCAHNPLLPLSSFSLLPSQPHTATTTITHSSRPYIKTTTKRWHRVHF